MSQLQCTNIEYCRCARSYLEELIGRKDYRAGIRYFETIRGELENLPDDLRGIILSLAAKAHRCAGELKKALPLIRRAVSALSNAIDNRDQLAAAYLVLGDTLRELGEYNEAIRSFRDAESIFRRIDDYSGAVDALNRLAGIRFREGEFEACLKSLLEAVEFARRTEETDKLAFLFGNIGRVYTLLGKIPRAEEYIKMNIDLSTRCEDNLNLARARLSLGYIYIQSARYRRAEEILSAALELIREEGFVNEEIIHMTYSGELAVRTGQLESAWQLLNEAYQRSRKISAESLLTARPLRWLAELLVKRGDYRKALTFVNRAYPLMQKLQNQVELGALTRLKAVCFENMGKKEDARNFYGEACSLLEKYRARIELAECMELMSNSELFDSTRRIMYRCRTEDLIRTCRIKRNLDPLPEEISETPRKADESAEFGSIEPDKRVIGQSPAIMKIIRQLNLLRTTDIPILLTGETGVGKDHMARYFHSVARPGRPYVAVNCAAIPESLIEAELFGHDKGAFTGAERNRRGLFEVANGGVLLLDEIGELPLALQAKLLQVLESRKFRPLGTAREIEIDIILLAATNRDLEKMVREGTFRQDLYYRLAGIIMEVPPLRRRKEDIPLLLDKFMRQYGLLNNGTGPDSAIIRSFVNYDWPGNIRQLDNKVRQLAALTKLSDQGELAEIATALFGDNTEEPEQSLYEQIERLEKKLLTEALVSAGGNKSEAARMLAIHESTFRAKMKRYSLESAIS